MSVTDLNSKRTTCGVCDGGGIVCWTEVKPVDQGDGNTELQGFVRGVTCGHCRGTGQQPQDRS